MIRAVVLDLDGTLIGRDEVVSDRVARAVAEVSRRVPVSIATGREASHAARFARQLSLTAPQISDGGAVILDPQKGDLLWTAPLRPEVAQEIVESLHTSGTAFIATHPEGSIHSIDGIARLNLIRVSALDIDEQEADRLAARFQPNPELNATKVFLPYNDLWAVDFTRSDVDKAAAATRLGTILGVATGDMAGAGDSYNDLSLLRVCGVSIAMGDAPAELKSIADYVAPTAEEDGLAVAIEEFILPQL